jgi:hypothetical protein
MDAIAGFDDGQGDRGIGIGSLEGNGLAGPESKDQVRSSITHHYDDLRWIWRTLQLDWQMRMRNLKIDKTAEEEEVDARRYGR